MKSLVDGDRTVKTGGRSPHGERGLKLGIMDSLLRVTWSRSPHGERGLKSDFMISLAVDLKSLPTRGAWIEIY